MVKHKIVCFFSMTGDTETVDKSLNIKRSKACSLTQKREKTGHQKPFIQQIDILAVLVQFSVLGTVHALPDHTILKGYSPTKPNKITMPDHSKRFDLLLSTPKQLSDLIKDQNFLAPETPSEQILRRFKELPNTQCLPVVAQGLPIGTVYCRDLLPLDQHSLSTTAQTLMHEHAGIVVQDESIEDFSARLSGGNWQPEGDHIVVCDASGHFTGRIVLIDLLRCIATTQLRLMRYTHPLTGLPGAVPIDQQLDQLLDENRLFVVVHCDLNDFKAYNDAYGYAKGDEVLLFIADLLRSTLDPELDFVGHYGSDDFVIIMQSPDWFDHCETIVRRCESEAPRFYARQHQKVGGISAFDRLGHRVFHPFFSLSVGIVQVEPGKFFSHHEVTAAATEVKKRAKSTLGSAIYIDERSYQNTTTQMPFMRN